MAMNDYKGVAGYQRMFAEVKESLYREFPEAKGVIYLANRLGDPAEEIKNAEKYLGIPHLDEILKKELAPEGTDFAHDMRGRTISATRPDGRTVQFAYGWPPTRLRDKPADLTPDDIEILAGVHIHELSHALHKDDYRAVVNRFGDNSPEFYRAQRLAESRADGFRVDVLARNGADMDNIYGLAADYDSSQRIDRMFMQPGRPGGEAVQSYMGEPHPYNPGEEMLTLAHRFYHDKEQHYPRRTPESYHLHGMRDSLKRVGDVFETSPKNQPVMAYFLRADSLAVEEAAKALQADGSSAGQIKLWIHSHPDLFYGVPKAEAADAYLSQDRPLRYNGAKPQVSSLEQATGRAMEMLDMDSVRQSLARDPLFAPLLRKLNDPGAVIPADMEQEIFRKLLPDGKTPSMKPEAYVAVIAEHPGLKERLDDIRAHGKTIDAKTIRAVMEELEIDTGKIPPAVTNEDRWDSIRYNKSTVLTGMQNAVHDYYAPPTPHKDTQPFTDKSPATLAAAWTMWQQLVSGDNPALKAAQALNAVEAAQLFSRLPPQTIHELANGKPVGELMPQLQALLATQNMDAVGTGMVAPPPRTGPETGRELR